MAPSLASLLYITGIIGLFLLCADRKRPMSKALWIPIAWLLINGSRPVSMWFAPSTDTIGTFSGSTALVDSMEDGSPFDRNVYLVILVAGLYVMSNRRAALRGFLHTNTPLLMYVGFCALSTVWSDYT